MTADRFYGFQDTALLCEHVITSLFSVTSTTSVEIGSQGLDTPPASPNSKDSPPPLAEFIAYALYRTRLPISITHQALLLLSRLKTRYPSARGTSTSPHRLFLSSLMLSSKISMDDTYSNKSWQVVGQNLFALREVNQMERELFAFLGWNVVVRDEELAAWVSEVVAPYESAKGKKSLALASAANISTPTRSLAASMEDRKRRRATSTTTSTTTTPSPIVIASTSRSASPETIRHRNAADAASSLLRTVAPISTKPRPRSSYTTRPSYSSSSSSAFSSPQSGSLTPDSPTTPASDGGPLTPSHSDGLASPPSWTSYEKKSTKEATTSAPESIQIAAW